LNHQKELLAGETSGWENFANQPFFLKYPLVLLY
jgi:hypothetical protein